MEFLYSLNRLNVATSRAMSNVIVVASPKLFEPELPHPPPNATSQRPLPLRRTRHHHHRYPEIKLFGIIRVSVTLILKSLGQSVGAAAQEFEKSFIAENL